MKKQKIVVIGAGPAGLTAAYELLQKKGDYEVEVLESQNQVGGISKTIKHNGNRMDIGGHRFFSKNDRVMEWWFNILPIQGYPSYDDKILKADKPYIKGGRDPEKEDDVMLIRRRISRIYYLKKFFDYPVKLKIQTFINMGFLRTAKVVFSYLKTLIVKRNPEKSLEDFMINRFGVALFHMFFENYTEKLWGRHPSEISAAWGAQRIKGLSVKEILKDILSKPFNKKKDVLQKNVETSLIEQFFYPKYGPGQLWEAVAKQIEVCGGIIHKKRRVSKIEVKGNKINEVICENGQRFKGDIFISSMPIKDLIEALPEKSMNSDIRKDAINLPYRDFITVGLLIKKLKIKNNSKLETIRNIIPDCWMYIQEPEVKLGRLQVFNNWSPYMLADHENNVWLGLEYFCDEGDGMWNMSDKDFISFAIKELDLIGIIDSKDVLDSIRINIQKAYPAYFGSYERFDKIKDYLNSFENLYCVGRNGQHRYNNMDHSMLTSFNTVDDIVSGGALGKEKIWDVNVEEKYHERKNRKHD